MESYLRKKLPVWYLERFLPEVAVKLEKEMGEVRDKTISEYTALHDGDEAEYLRLYWELSKIIKKVSGERDKEIARNIDKAEEDIRERYDHLRDKETIRLTVMMGSLHFPESFTKHPVEVINLMANLDNLSHKCQLDIRSGKSFEEMKPLMLEAGYYELSEMKK